MALFDTLWRGQTAPLAAVACLALGCASNTGFQTSTENNEAEGNGKMTMTPDSLEFADLDVDIAKSAVFKITSTGDNNLKIYSVGLADSAGGVFYIEEVDNIELAPGSEREFAAVATIATDAEGLYEGELRIRTNDVDALDLRVPMTAWTPGFGPDTGSGDTGSGDTGTGDTGSGSSDTGTGDTGSGDSGTGDSGTGDTGTGT